MLVVEAEENSLLSTVWISAIHILSRTRESLSASGCTSNSDGQLLGKALAKQLTVRRAELISSSPLKDASVSVGTSIPATETSGEDSRRFFATPARSPNPNPSFFAPEDHDLPLRS